MPILLSVVTLNVYMWSENKQKEPRIRCLSWWSCCSFQYWYHHYQCWFCNNFCTYIQLCFCFLPFALIFPPFIVHSRPLSLSLGASTVPIQCLDDVEKNNNHAIPRVSVPRPPSAPPLPSCSGRPCPPVGGPSGALLPDSLKEDCWYNGPWPSQTCSGEALVGSDTCSVVLPPPPLNQASLDDSSRSFPSPPKPSDAMFWEGHSATSNSSSIGNCTPRSPPNAEWAKPYWEGLQWQNRWINRSV